MAEPFQRSFDRLFLLDGGRTGNGEQRAARGRAIGRLRRYYDLSWDAWLARNWN